MRSLIKLSLSLWASVGVATTTGDGDGVSGALLISYFASTYLYSPTLSVFKPAMPQNVPTQHQRYLLLIFPTTTICTPTATSPPRQ